MADFQFIIENEYLYDTDQEILFADDPVTRVPKETDWLDLLVKAGVFRSRTQGRQNWNNIGKKIGYCTAIFPGWTEVSQVGKLRHRIYIWKPIRGTL